MSQAQIALILFGTLIVLFIIKVPVAFSLILSSVLVLYLTGTGLEMVPKRLFTSCDSFSFMAVPFFLLAGTLMSQGGISERLCTFINSIFGRLPGGLGIVAIVACAFFAAISGSGAATTAAIGGMMIPEMVKHGYDRDFSAATSASGGCIGTIIPPSIPFVTYGVLTGCSVSTLFMAGFLPGILMAICLCAAVVVVSMKNGYRDSYKASGAEIWSSFKRALLALLMPVIVLGGIYAGIFTPTEAAVVAVVYGFVVGVFIYRNIDLKLLLRILRDAAVSTAQIMILICAASLFGYVLTTNRIPDMIASAVLGLSSNKIVILLLINVMLLIVGTFMDTTAALIIMVPIFYPIVTELGVNPVHFAMIICTNLAVGQVTPPFGCNLFVACGVAGVGLEGIAKKIIPFIVALVVCVLLVTYIEPISLFLPTLLGAAL
ncbi:MAG: TRAP transporter large permease [Eubacteriales bacterium]|nr:TRAP transporter large permease [Eubacteriales bacterium]